MDPPHWQGRSGGESDEKHRGGTPSSQPHHQPFHFPHRQEAPSRAQFVLSGKAGPIYEQ